MIVKLLTETATLPTRATDGSAAYDLYADEDVVITAGSPPVTVKTGVSCKFPPNHFGKIECRSGLGYKYGMVCHGGVIDNDYYDVNGNIAVIITAKVSFEVKRGHRVAQLLVLPCWTGPVSIYDDNLDDDSQNNNSNHTGFGSTGL